MTIRFFIGQLLCLIMVITQITSAQQKTEKVIIPQAHDDAWWIGIISHGEIMPLENGYHADLSSNYGNQIQPLLLSGTGEVIWSEMPFKINFKNDTLEVSSVIPSLQYNHPGKTLKEAFQYASEIYFPPSGKMPDELMFTSPQYNTWIELMYDQNQADIMNYARQIVANGFPPGVLMIDDNWQEDYGKWNFHPGRFSDPKAMIDSLHQMGFKVMLWICPMISPDCDVYRSLESKKILLEDKAGQPAIIRWWNGASALIDLSKPGGQTWFKDQLNYLQDTYHVDGFKFDAGDFHHYENCYSGSKPVSPQEQCEAYARVGLDYPLNEYRAMWKMGGQPLVNRLRDKAHNWEDLNKLIPDILVEGLMGYSFTCPDMIGGGEFTSFLPGKNIDQELIVRSAQCHALMPMMQFSVAPWKILDETHLATCKQAIETRKKFTPVILELAKESSNTGEPIARSMEYVFPHQGYAGIKDQFMLGDKILVAPVTKKNVKTRKVALPPGIWKDGSGKNFKGNKVIDVSVSLQSLPYFIKER